MIFSILTGKSIRQNLTHIHDSKQTNKQTGNRRDLTQPDNRHLQKSTANIMVKEQMFSY